MTGELKRLEQETVRLERLKVLAEEIRQEHQACLVSMRQGMEHALKVGELLLQARENVWHGEWENWIEMNCGFTPRHAWNYMKLAGNKALFNSEIISEMTISQALQLTRIHVEVEQELKEKKAKKAKWNLENEDNQVKTYLDALKAFTQAVEDVIPVAEYGKFSPEGIRFTVRRHEGLRQELARLEDVLNQKLKLALNEMPEKEEPVFGNVEEGYVKVVLSLPALKVVKSIRQVQKDMFEYLKYLDRGGENAQEIYEMAGAVERHSAWWNEVTRRFRKGLLSFGLLIDFDEEKKTGGV